MSDKNKKRTKIKNKAKSKSKTPAQTESKSDQDSNTEEEDDQNMFETKVKKMIAWEQTFGGDNIRPVSPKSICLEMWMKKDDLEDENGSDDRRIYSTVHKDVPTSCAVTGFALSLTSNIDTEIKLDVTLTAGKNTCTFSLPSVKQKGMYSFNSVIPKFKINSNKKTSKKQLSVKIRAEGSGQCALSNIRTCTVLTL